jgi:hypothetical protein
MAEVTEGDRKLVSSYLHYLILALRSNERFSTPGRFTDAQAPMVAESHQRPPLVVIGC